jgi:starch synthase
MSSGNAGIGKGHFPRLGVDIRLVVLSYPSALRVAAEQRPETKLDVPDAALTEVISARLPDSGLPIWLIDSPSLFRREAGLYQNLDGRDWGDNAQRFANLTRVAAKSIGTQDCCRFSSLMA